PHKVYLWDAATGRAATPPPLEVDNNVLALAYSPDGRYLATAESGSGVRLWDPATGLEVRRLEGLAGTVGHLGVSPASRSLLASGSEGWNRMGESRLWDVATGKPASAPLRHTLPVRGAAFSPDGGRVLTRSGLTGDQAHGEIRIWDVAPWRARYVKAKPGE